MHKFKESLTAMIGDFANMNKTPDFKAKSEAKDAESLDGKGDRKMGAGGRRHSLNITVGAEAIPQMPKRERSESICVGTSLPLNTRYTQKGRRSSAPCVSTSGASTQLKEKLKKMRCKDDTFAEHEELEESHTALKEVDEHDDEDETLTEAEEERIRARIAEQRERRPSSYLL